MDKEEKNQSLFTGNIIANFFIIVIPALPGIFVFIIAKELAGDFLLGQFPVFAGLSALLICFPLTLGIVKKIRTSVLSDKE